MTSDRLQYLIEATRPPITDRDPVDRDSLGPMVTGFLQEMLNDCAPTYTIASITERFLVQCIRHCIYFYQLNKGLLRPLFFSQKTYRQKQCGIDLWRSIHNLPNAFADRGNEDHWGVLEAFTRRYFKIKEGVCIMNDCVDYIDPTLWEDWD